MSNQNSRFTDNANGTVTDNRTGLMWLKNANPFGKPLPWLDAQKKASQLASGKGALADQSKPGDWRLPTINELLTLLDYRFLPSLPDTEGTGVWTEGNPFNNVITNAPYWSDTPIFLPIPAPPPPGSWISWFAYFGGGNVATDLQPYPHYAWPVKGELKQPNPRYTDNGNGTVTDNSTNLIWLKNANPFGQLTWAQATSAAANLEDGMHGLTDGSKPRDWRLPTIGEIESLFDPAYNNPAIANASGTDQWKPGDAFGNPDDPSSWVQLTNLYWSSSEYAGGTSTGATATTVIDALQDINESLRALKSAPQSDAVWVSLISVGNVATTVKNGFFYVWPVRCNK
jgi:hypothetical protein